MQPPRGCYLPHHACQLNYPPPPLSVSPLVRDVDCRRSWYAVSTAKDCSGSTGTGHGLHFPGEWLNTPIPTPVARLFSPLPKFDSLGVNTPPSFVKVHIASRCNTSSHLSLVFLVLGCNLECFDTACLFFFCSVSRALSFGKILRPTFCTRFSIRQTVFERTAEEPKKLAELALKDIVGDSSGVRTVEFVFEVNKSGVAKVSARDENSSKACAAHLQAS